MNRPLKAVVLAAGYATRLYPLTVDRPKCLLPIGGRSILDRLFEKLDGVQGLREAVVVTNSKFYGPIRAWRDGAARPYPVEVIDDGTTSNETRLGAIGDLELAVRRRRIDEDLLLLASDNYFEDSLEVFLEAARARPDAAWLGLHDLGDPSLASKTFGVIETDPDGRVIGFEEKPEKPKTSLIGTGIYRFPGATLPLISEYLASDQKQDAPGHYLAWLLPRVEIRGYRLRGMWYDIGNLQALEEADRALKGRSA